MSFNILMTYVTLFSDTHSWAIRFIPSDFAHKKIFKTREGIQDALSYMLAYTFYISFNLSCIVRGVTFSSLQVYTE
jgi:hypothetical protein